MLIVQIYFHKTSITTIPLHLLATIKWFLYLLLQFFITHYLYVNVKIGTYVKDIRLPTKRANIAEIRFWTSQRRN